MSRNRILTPEKRYAQVPRGTCRWCGGPVAPPKRTFCSDACVHEWRIRSDPGYVRECLWKRDHGICAHCGLDTVAEARERYEERHGRPYPEHWGKRGPWDADHIHPVHLGGGECGLEGYQTLCKDCHKAKTAREAAARAAAVRDPQPAQTADPTTTTEEPDVLRPTCGNHNGRLVYEGHPCELCGYTIDDWRRDHPQAVVEPAALKPTLSLVQSQEQEVEVQDSVSTSPIASEQTEAPPDLDYPQTEGWCGKYSRPAFEWDPCEDEPNLSKPCRQECEHWRDDDPRSDGAPAPKRRPDYGVIDRNTGELVQLSLLGAEWDQYKVESLRLSLSGGAEFIKSLFDQLVSGELSPGAIVEVVARGVVKEHAPVFKKDGHEGKTVILLEVVRSIEVIGHMTGPVEAAQNASGEAKVMEEDVDPEVALQEADDLRHMEEAEDA